ncbi:hypothetical protein [Streptomyces noursei]|nr:hypothetical protein [Streptomyces noursei]UWS76706.1 hypothetical protein N1H47_38940 [Streptomyces noursei]
MRVLPDVDEHPGAFGGARAHLAEAGPTSGLPAGPLALPRS